MEICARLHLRGRQCWLTVPERSPRLPWTHPGIQPDSVQSAGLSRGYRPRSPIHTVPSSSTQDQGMHSDSPVTTEWTEAGSRELDPKHTRTPGPPQPLSLLIAWPGKTLCVRLKQVLITARSTSLHCTCFDFQTSRTGMPAIIELGSSWAAELTVSLAPMTRTKSVSA